jgi:SNF2 family DNA or RNA helicase
MFESHLEQTQLKFAATEPKSLSSKPDHEIEYQRVLSRLPVPLSWFKMKPYLHQLKAFEFGLQHPRTALLLSIGSGKSFCAINLLRYRIKQGFVNRALIVSPISVFSTWEDELEKHSDLDFHVMRGGKATKLKILGTEREVPEVIVAGYESVRLYESDFVKKNFQMVICDESVKIKSPRAKVSQAFWRAFKKTPFKIIMTGLLTPNTIMDSYSQMKFLAPGVFGTRFAEFKALYGRFGGFKDYVFLGPKNVEDFKRKLYSVGISFRREEMFDLPPKIYERRTVELSPRERRAYDSMKENFLAELSSTEKVVAPNVLTQFLRLHQITSGHLSNGDGEIVEIGHSKLKEFTLFMEEEIIDSESNVLVFVQFIHTLKAVQAWAVKKKLNPAVVYGAVNTKKRGEEIRRFQKDPKCRLFLGQISTVSYGINLTQATVAIFLESNFSYGDRDQCEGRSHRLGQTKKVTIIDFVVPKSIDTYMLTILKRKKGLSKLIAQPRQLIEDGKRGLF